MLKITLLPALLIAVAALSFGSLDSSQASGRLIRPPKVDPCKKNPNGEKCKAKMAKKKGKMATEETKDNG